jgi:hypothetical protein
VRPRSLGGLAAFAASVYLQGISIGCTVRAHHAGDSRFLESQPGWRPGVTTALEVARDLGPPDLVRWSEARMAFIYRFQRRVETSLAVSFYLRLFRREHRRQEDSTLVVIFDADDRLLYHGKSEAPAEDWSGDLGLR